MKKLRFHTPDENGKSKCHVMHVGKTNASCIELKVHGTTMQHVQLDTYLGDVIASDGTNNKNVEKRVSRGNGLIADIMSILESISLGKHYFKIAVLLRETLFLNSILTNAESWYGISKTNIEDMEQVDKKYFFLKKVSIIA